MLATVVSLAVVAGPAAPGGRVQVPDLSAGDLAEGPYSRMHMLLEKTIFGFDVMTVDVRFDEETRSRLESIARGAEYSEELASRVTTAALEAQHGLLTLEFERDVGLNRWMEGARGGMSRAARAGLISREELGRVSENLPRWFAPVSGRGFREGDRVIYRIYPDRLHTLVVSPGGQLLVEHTDPGAAPGRSVLAGFLAPGTDFREPLVRSLLDD